MTYLAQNVCCDRSWRFDLVLLGSVTLRVAGPWDTHVLVHAPVHHCLSEPSCGQVWVKAGSCSWPHRSGGVLKSQEWEETMRVSRDLGETPLGRAVGAAVVWGF